jgi:hypothetical protein
MSETTTERTTETVGETSADTSRQAEAATGEATKSEGESTLGDAGKKALDAMKAERKAARDEAAAAKAERDALQAKLDGKEAEFTAAQEARKIKDAALAAANQRILKSEVKAAAKGVLADPQDAYKFLDLDSFEVDDDGNVDESTIATALADLVAAKPYLSAQGGQRFQGGADGGARNDSSKPSQLTKSDMDRMSPEQIDAAHNEGRFNDLLGSR